MKLTTTNLQLPSPRAWWNLPTPLAAAICIFALLTIAALVGQLRSAQQTAAVPTPALDPIIIIASPLPVQPPTAIPPAAQVAYQQPIRYITAWAAPDGVVLGPIPEPPASAIKGRWGDGWLMLIWNGGPAWIRAADVGMHLADVAPALAPQVIYVAAPMPAVATPEPQYAVTNDGQPNGDFYTTPPHVDPAAQQALIGSDPNALACGGSPMCGGLTNAQAQAALDAQRAGR